MTARDTCKSKTSSYDVFAEQYAPDDMEKFSSYQMMDPPVAGKRRPQGQKCITEPEAMVKTGMQGVPILSQVIYTSFQDSRTQDAPEAMEKCYSHQR
jgi:hypothetical protein